MPGGQGNVVSDIENDNSVCPSHSVDGLEKLSHAEVMLHFAKVAGKARNGSTLTPRQPGPADLDGMVLRPTDHSVSDLAQPMA